MAIIRWDPFSVLSPIRGSWPFEDEDFQGLVSPTAGDNLEMYEEGGNVVVKANVAGVTPEEVDVEFKDGRVWIRAQASEEKKEGKKYYKKSTRAYSYTLDVPGVDLVQEPEAEIEKGILTLTFKKIVEPKPKKIVVKSRQ